MFPSNWTRTTIGEIAELGSGTTPSRQKEAEFYRDGSTWWVKTGDLNNGCIHSTDERITPKAIQACSCRLYPPGTVLVAMYGGFRQIGRTGLLVVTAAINQALTAITLDPEKADGSFIQHWLNHQVNLWKRLAGSSRKDPNVTKTEVASFPVLLPPILEQKIIAKVLSAWDMAICQLADLVYAKLRFKQILMQQLLAGKKRLITSIGEDGVARRQMPSANAVASLEVEFGITGKSFQRGVPCLNACPDGWNTRELRDVLEVVERSTKLNDEKPYQLVTAKRYRGGIVPRERVPGSQIKTKTQFCVATGDFLISRRQIIHGACGIVPESLDRAIVSNEYACLRVKRDLDPHFLRYISHSVYFQQTCYHASVGVALEKMIFKLDKWIGNRIHLPPLEEQRRIVLCLSRVAKVF